MARAALTGTRLRERRLALGLRQADVAAAVGVSAPYLNLIEHNRRRVSPLLLESLADHLGVAAEALEDGAEGAQIEELRAAATALPGSGAELDRAEEFAGRFPGWAALARGLARRAAGLERAVEALNDRMTHDPHLSDSLHEVLSAVASVRSTAAILAETEDIEPEWRMRFLKNLHGDSERLALGAEALVAFLDGSDRAEAQVMIAPQEEVEAWLAARGWHLAELEPGGPGSAVLEGEVAGLASVAARRLARDWMQVMARDAARVPLEALETEADPVRLAAALGVEVTVVLRRMALSPGSEAGLALCDASGALVLRKPAEGFAFPRFGSACPLWPLYAALGRTGSPVVADLVVAGRGGRRFRAIAHCAIRHPEGLGGVELREAAMLVQPLRGSVALVGDMAGAQVVGSSCRVCARGDCPARREPSILTDASMG
ncbi:helix-turn-helix transcriptional regulator [Fuscovulum ytuae]|uniref:Short-chain fatty acyl-CoA regulator family protein n=1 Tax=Fuscovulum ytuae TaxID=3042299 RepID=A0ABY8Q7I5_9RHOB|nr:helix-turn-helix transcriptional regulator [Fuscovulum sp. YMD61]WGV16814.1 short-chain fatty acyl-CoA regulator family protein [Fuscovulum sp. YMD61]